MHARACEAVRAFRSILLPLQAVVLDLLSIAAAWGLTVRIWQNGYGSETIWGIDATQAINVEMPIVIFAFLFGISMDSQQPHDVPHSPVAGYRPRSASPRRVAGTATRRLGLRR